MKAYSVQVINEVKEMHFTIERSVIDEITKVIVNVSTNDDNFEFNFTGAGCDVFADRWFDMVANKANVESERNKRKKLEKENKQLKEELGQWKKELAECLVLRDRAQTELEYIKQEKENERVALIHGVNYTVEGLVNRVLDLEEALHESKKNDDAVTFDDVIKICNEYAKGIGKEIVDILDDAFAGTAPKQVKRNSGRYPLEQEKKDNVNHPSHYETGKFECIEVMQEVFGITAVCDFCKCNAFKYIYRMDRKNGDEDAKKAIWYLNKYLELGKEERSSKEIELLSKYHDPCDHCVHLDVEMTEDPCKSCHLFSKFEESNDGGTDNGRKAQVPEGE